MTERAVLVTGAAGFVGSVAVRTCNQAHAPVISVDAPEYFDARTEHKGIDFGTRVDRMQLFDRLEAGDFRPTVIFHLGACANTMETDWVYLLKMNVEYSKKLWNYAVKHDVPFIYASSAATYGDGAFGYDDDPALIPNLRPLNAYGQSKQDFDVWALEEVRRGNAPRVWSGWKFFNVYGIGERHKAGMASVVLHAFDQIKSSGKVKLFRSHRADIADGYQKRDFVYVDDVIDVLNFALHSGMKPGIYNLGTGKARTFLDLASAVFDAMKIEPNIEFIDTPLALRDKYQYLTEAKMERVGALGYSKPFTSLEDGVRKYVALLSESS